MVMSNDLKSFPVRVLLYRFVLSVAPAVIGWKVGGFFLWLGVILTLILGYFILGITLYRNLSLWRRIGRRGFTIWIKMISARLSVKHELYNDDVDLLRKDALKATLIRIYPSLTEERARSLAEQLISEVKGPELVTRIETFFIRNGMELMKARAKAEQYAQVIRREENIGGTIIAYTLAKIIGSEFGELQEDRYWQATFKGTTISI